LAEQENLFNIRDWVPYQLWRLSLEAGYILEDNYSLKYNINGESWRFMAMLASSAPISAKALGAHLDMDQVQVTRALSKLLDNGYITRRTDPHDRRKAILNLSEKGTEVYRAIVDMAMNLEHKLLAEMTEAERDNFKKILRNLLGNVEKIRNS
jgi:DNA-binding MarR family transcriptional regulator